MTQSNSSPLAAWAVRMAGATAALIGAFWLMAWLGGWAAQWSAAGALTGTITPKTNMALCQLLCGVALLLEQLATTRPRRIAVAALALFVLLAGLLTFSEHLFRRDLGIDQLLASEAPGAAGTASPNRMGPPGSVSLILLGAGVLALAFKRRALAPFLGLTVSLINLSPAVGFLYRIEGFYSLPHLTDIALPTVVALFSLGTGLMLAHTKSGPMASLLLADPGGALLRRMLPAVILIPLALGYLHMQGQLRGLYDTATGTGLLVIALLLLSSLVLWLSAAHLSRRAASEAEAQRAVRVSEERLRLAQSSAQVGIWEWQPRNGRLSWTAELENLYGYAEGTFPGTYKGFSDRVHPDDLAEVERLRDKAVNAHKTFDFDFRVCLPSGDTKWVNCKGSAVYDETGNPERLFGVNMDITERKRAQEALRESGERFRAVLENMSEGVMLFDPEGNLILQNAASLRIHGFDAPEEGRIEHQDLPATWEAWDENGRHIGFDEWPASRVFRGERFQNQVLHVLRVETGQRFYGSYNGSPILDAQGRLTLGFITIRDITEQVRATEALKESEAELLEAQRVAHIGSWTWDAQTDKGTASDEMLRIYGFDPATQTIPNFADQRGLWYPPEEWDRLNAAVQESFRTGVGYSLEVQALRKDERIWVHTRSEVTRNAEGRIVGLRGTVQDITERKQAEEAVRESRAKLQAAFASMTEAIFVADDEGRLTDFNDEFIRFHRFKDRAECSKSIADCPKYLEAYFADGTPAPPEMWALPRALRGESSTNTEYRLRRKDSGETWWGSYSFAPIVETDGRIAGAIVAAREITELKAAQAKLSETTRRFQTIVDQAPIAIYVKNREGRFVFGNRKLEQYTGQPLERLLGMTDYDFAPKEDADRWREHDRKVLEGQRAEFEETGTDRDGRPYINISVKFPLSDESGTPVEVCGISTDITERKRAGEALRAGEEKYRNLFENIEEMVAVYKVERDDGGRIVERRLREANRAFLRAVGVSSVEEIRGKTSSQIFGKAWSELHLPAVQKAMDTGQVQVQEVCRPESGRHYITSVVPLVTDTYLGTAWDITPIKMAEAAQQALIEERTRLLESERSARSEAERANRLKDEFLANLSHELRTPLNAILGWTQILRRGHSDAVSIAKGLEVIERNTRAQTQLISDLLDVSRIISGKMRLETKNCDAVDALDAAIDSIVPAAEAKRIRIERLVEPLSGPILGDPSRLQQAFWNLLSNAIKFTPSGGRVQIVMRQTNSRVEVVVRDTGIGIDADLLPHIFERFRQADSSASKEHAGLGLGLAIARHLVEMHGGTVHAESPGKGQGATFTVTLPIISLKLHEEAGTETSIYEELRQREVSFTGLKVLYVDDEPDTREMVKRLLEGHGVIVTLADCAAQAIAILRELRPDALVGDVGMPGMDGYEMIRRIRELPPEAGGLTPAIALTAYSHLEDRTRAMLAGYQYHLAKPVEAVELITALRAITQRFRELRAGA